MDIKLKRLETYQCPLWSKNTNDNPGCFDEAGFELDHIDELSINGDNTIENFQALCKSCHSVKTKKFMMKKSNHIYHPIYCKQLSKQGKHTIYLSDSHTITQHTKIWSKNRPPDMMRVHEIKKDILKNDIVDGILYFANILDEGIVCYDGNHRREALSLIEKSYKILINVVELPSDNYLCTKFIKLNMCVPITELYLNCREPTISSSGRKKIKFVKKNNIEKIKQSIQILSEYYANKWKEHRKTSPIPRKPNFNWDSLQLKLKNIIDSQKHIETDNIDILKDCIDNYNTTICTKKYTYNVSIKMLQKCDKNDCYIFLES